MAVKFINNSPINKVTGKVKVAALIIKNLISKTGPFYCLRLSKASEGDEAAEQFAGSTFKNSIQISKIKGASTFEFNIFKDLSYIGMFQNTQKLKLGTLKFPSSQVGIKQNLFDQSNPFALALGGLQSWVKSFNETIVGNKTEKILDYGADVSTKQLRNNVVQDLSDEIEHERKEASKNCWQWEIIKKTYLQPAN